jgi:hypothetical protein
VNPQPVFRINRGDVTHETFDDEVVLINFKSGSYFSAGGTGREILERLGHGGVALTDLLASLQARYAVEPSALSAAVEAFLADLEREGLIASVSDGGGGRPAHAAAPEPPARQTTPPGVAGTSATSMPGPERLPFEPPVLRVYTDMQALLLLDPIHEVDESGWPNVKPTPGPRE